MKSGMGSGRHRWKFSFHSRSPSSPSSPASSHTSPSNSFTAVSSPPAEFLCPISGELMANPVIISSGHTFERACIHACDDLSVTPPSLPSYLPRPLQLIPNSALRSAIFSWCDRESHPRPIPISADRALHLVRRLFPIDSTRLADSSSSICPDTPPLVPESNKKKMSGSSYSSSSTTLSSYNSSSSYSSTEIAPVEVEDSSSAPATSLEDEILDMMIVHQEEAVAALRRYCRESSGRRSALCTPRILAALRPLLLSRNSCVQAEAAAAVVNLSLEQGNKVLIVRAGIVPALVDALRCGGVEARDHAAGALFSLAVDEDNRVALGVLGAVPPLLALFCKRLEPPRARRDAGMALCHLSQSVPNKSKIARAPGAVKSLLAVAAEKGELELGLGKVALMVLCNIAGSSDGRAAMMEGGAVAGVVGLLMGDVAAAEKEKCVAALYGMSRGSLRFRGLARAAGAEEALRRVAADDEVGEAAKEMAERTMRVVTGEENVEEMMAVAAEGSVVSDGVLSFPRMYRRDFSGGRAAASAANSAAF